MKQALRRRCRASVETNWYHSLSASDSERLWGLSCVANRSKRVSAVLDVESVRFGINAGSCVDSSSN